MKTLLLSLVILLCACFVNAGIPPELVAELQGETVTIVTSHGQGSGNMVTRHVGEDDITFVWTAAHVVDGLQKTGTWENVTVVQEKRQDGIQCGKVEVAAKIIKFSREQDLCLLQIVEKNFTKVNTRYCLDGKVPACGTDVIHVGSLHGMFGHNSISQGIISQTDKHLEGNTFDQTSSVAAPGSSGGPMFLSDGRYIGMLTMGCPQIPLCNFIVPMRRIQAYCKAEKIEWAIDDKLTPTAEELSCLPEPLAPTPAPPQIEIEIPGLPRIPGIPGIGGRSIDDVLRILLSIYNTVARFPYCPVR